MPSGSYARRLKERGASYPSVDVRACQENSRLGRREYVLTELASTIEVAAEFLCQIFPATVTQNVAHFGFGLCREFTLQTFCFHDVGEYILLVFCGIRAQRTKSYQVHVSSLCLRIFFSGHTIAGST